MLFTSTSAAFDFSGNSLPFAVGDIVDTAWSLIQLLGPFLALGLALVLAPRLVSFIKSIMSKNGKSA